MKRVLFPKRHTSGIIFSPYLAVIFLFTILLPHISSPNQTTGHSYDIIIELQRHMSNVKS